MTKLYQAKVFDTSLSMTNGLHINLSEGTPITVNGTPMVETYGVIVPAKGWHPTKEEAMAEAAGVVDLYARRLQVQASTLRTEVVPHAI